MDFFHQYCLVMQEESLYIKCPAIGLMRTTGIFYGKECQAVIRLPGLIVVEALSLLLPPESGIGLRTVGHFLVRSV